MLRPYKHVRVLNMTTADIARVGGHYAVQGSSRSTIMVSIESDVSGFL